MIDEEEREWLEIVTEHVERIRNYVPTEEFNEQTAQVIAKGELDGRTRHSERVGGD